MSESPKPESDQSKYSFRNAQPDDAEQITKLYKTTWLATYPNNEYGVTREDIEAKVELFDSPEEVERVHDAIAQRNEKVLQLVCEADGRIVAHSRLVKTDDGPNRLRTIYVLPEYHGAGIARQLIAEGLAWLGNDKAVSLEVAKYNARAIGFYEKYGFKIVGDGTSPASGLPSGAVIPEFEMVRAAI
jgi:GNAT superfamily N-acetyltransferase